MQERPSGRGERVILGYDPARDTDRSTVAVLDASEQPYRVTELHDLSGLDYRAQTREVAALVARYDATVTIDATNGNGASIADFLRGEGCLVEEFKFTGTSKVEAYTGLGVAIEKREIVLPRHEELLRELRWMRAERLPSGRLRYQPRGGAGDDHVDAVVLALAGAGGAPSCHAAPLSIMSDYDVIAPDDESEHAHDYEGARRATAGACGRNVVVLGPDGLPEDWHDFW